jgi:hypothetical protein
LRVVTPGLPSYLSDVGGVEAGLGDQRLGEHDQVGDACVAIVACGGMTRARRPAFMSQTAPEELATDVGPSTNRTRPNLAKNCGWSGGLVRRPATRTVHLVRVERSKTCSSRGRRYAKIPREIRPQCPVCCRTARSCPDQLGAGALCVVSFRILLRACSPPCIRYCIERASRGYATRASNLRQSLAPGW